MYIPDSFLVDDAAKLAAFMCEHSFATLVTNDGTGLVASHLPMLFRPDAGPHGTLVAHMARANAQWRHFAAGREALVIFHGPHGYVSPLWYQTQPAVPTWNYATVHAYGVPAIFDDHARVAALLGETVSAYDSTWSGELPGEFRDKLTRAIVAFEIPITRIEGKFKLGQNRSLADQQGVFDALAASGDPGNLALARLMLAECVVRETKG